MAQCRDVTALVLRGVAPAGRVSGSAVEHHGWPQEVPPFAGWSEAPGLARQTGEWCFDLVCLQRLANGEREVFWDLWAVHQPAVFSLCLERLGGRRPEAEDVCSRVMQKAHHVLPEVASGIRNFGGWLARLTVNLCIDAQRADRRRFQGCCAVELDTLDDAVMASLCDRESPPDKVFLRGEMSVALLAAVAALPERLMESARLYFFEERTYAEIAAGFQTSSANIRKRIQEARVLLRDALGEYAPRPHVSASSSVD